jgi:hypothetical protein
MLQRIQSLYLLLVFVFALLFLSLPLGYVTLDGMSYAVRATGVNLPDQFQELVSMGFWQPTVIILFFGILVLTVYTTFQYKRRLLQVRLGRLNMLIHMGLIISTFFLIDNVKTSVGAVSSSYGAGIFLPVASLMFIFLANRAILSDEKRIRAADRIR